MFYRNLIIDLFCKKNYNFADIDQKIEFCLKIVMNLITVITISFCSSLNYLKFQDTNQIFLIQY